MNNEIQLYDKLNDPMSAIDRMGEFFARSGMFGCERVEQGKVLAMVCIAEKKSPVEITRTYDIVEGKLRKKALAALAEFRGKGGKHNWLRSGDEPAENESDRKAVLELTPPDGKPLTYSYSMADARAEGLVRDKSRWTKRPGNMLRARCISNGLGMVMPEIYAGDDDNEQEPRESAPMNLAAAVVTAPTVEVQPAKVEQPSNIVEAQFATSPPADAKAEADAGLAPVISVAEVMQPTQPSWPELPSDLVRAIEDSIGEHALAAIKWMRNQNPPWLIEGQGLRHLTEGRARRIVKQRDGFLKAVLS